MVIESTEVRTARLERQRQYRKQNAAKINEQNKKWLRANPEKAAAKDRRKYLRRKPKIRIWLKQHREKLKREVFEAYGGCFCACCGESEIMLLALDHINNDGFKHRKRNRKLTGRETYYWAINNGFPAVLQVLCASCNWGKHVNGGECPHVTTRRELFAA